MRSPWKAQAPSLWCSRGLLGRANSNEGQGQTFDLYCGVDHAFPTDVFAPRSRSYRQHHHAADERKRSHGRTREGPASYFPSIEKKYGRPIAEWKDLIRASPLTEHMD